MKIPTKNEEGVLATVEVKPVAKFTHRGIVLVVHIFKKQVVLADFASGRRIAVLDEDLRLRKLSLGGNITLDVLKIVAKAAFERVATDRPELYEALEAAPRINN